METQGAPLGPGDLQRVFDCLQGSLSQDSIVQKQSEAALYALETRPGFCSCLSVSSVVAVLLSVLKDSRVFLL